jgi:predicted small secreted protein
MNKLLISMILGCVVLVAGCNTMSGVGKDVQSAGKAIEGTAEKSK